MLTLPQALERAHAHWNAGQADQAEILCQRVLAAWPGQADALHLLGLMAHAFGNLDVAIERLRQACQAPRAPAQYFSNLAEMCRQRGLYADGEQAARRAVAMAPQLVGAWTNLGILLQEAGQYDESRACLERVVSMQPESPEAYNNLGNTCRRQGALDLAEQHYRQAIALHRDYAQAHSNLAFLLSTLGRFDEAASEAQLAIELSPRLIEAYLNLADVENARRRPEAALRALEMLRVFAPQHPAALMGLSKVLRRIERLDESLAYARAAVAAVPQSADAQLTLAQALQSLGDTEQALAAFAQAAQLPGTTVEEAMIGRATVLMEAGRQADALKAFDEVVARFPQSVHGLLGRADARKFKQADDPDIVALEAFLADPATRSSSDLTSAHFALGKAYMDIGVADKAFHHLDTGNRAKRSTFQYDSATTSRWMARIAQQCSAEWLAQASTQLSASQLPIFIVGMPRSGTTLIEQILASHPQVTGAGELSSLRLLIDARGPFPESLDKLGGADLTQLGQAYLDRITPLAQGRDRLVDKMPANFLYAGLIARALPGARIIHARRNAVDTCLSCYTKLFGGDQSFAYDQTELGRFYLDYERMMEHWRAVLPPDRFLEVDYEAVVDDLDAQARRLIAFAGLPWDDACLEFHKSDRVVRTASVNQVRQPIYRSSKGRWQPYAAQLAPLLAALGVAQS